MKKQQYIDMGISSGLTPSQIEQVLCGVLDISREEFFTLRDISSRYIYEVQQIFYRMSHGEIQEYSLQKANFYGRDFFIDSRVLVPRNDTEILVEQALKKIHTDIDVWECVYVDVGTGSGCIAVSILCEMYPLQFDTCYAIDIMPDALEVAKENSMNYNLAHLQLKESSLLECLGQEPLWGKHLCITANLPYIKDGETQHMDTQVLEHEPHSALFWWPETGFELYQACIKQCFELKHIHQLQSIHMFIEIGFDQRDVSQEFLESLWLSFEYFSDNASIDRVVYITGF